MAVARPAEDTKSGQLTSAHSPSDPEGSMIDSPIPPMTWSLMGRFFAVPFLIISVIVGGAILVVFLFGGPAAPQRRSIEELLKGLESTSGQRSAGVLLPREKELWQMALELSLRLEKKDQELTPEELNQTASRLAAMVEAQIVESEAAIEPLAPDDAAVRSRRLEFLIHALGRTQRPEAVAPLVKIVALNREPYVAAALQELGNLHQLPEARTAVPQIVGLLAKSPKPETAMIAATALSVLAQPGDESATAPLKSLMFTSDGEVSWSAAMALARLGDPSGKTILLDMLDRTFWQTGERYQITDEGGVTHRYPMPPQRIDQLLIAAIDASAHLHNKDLWDAIETLKSDPSPSVRTRAAEVAVRRPATTASG